MRWVLVAVLALLWTVPAVAQERRGRVLLEDGRTFEGVVLHLDQERIQLRVGGRNLTFKVNRIAGYEAIPPEAGPATDAGDPAETPAAEIREDEAPQSESPPPAPGGAAPRKSPSKPPPSKAAPDAVRASMLSRRIGVLKERYSWIEPKGPLQLASIALLTLLYVTLAMQLAARFANAENREMIKAIAAAIVVCVATVVQLATVPFDTLTLPVLLVGNTVGWLLLTRILYGLGFFASCTMFFSALLVCGMVFVVFEVVDYTLKSIGAPGVVG